MNTPGSRQPAPGTLLDGLHVLVTGGTGSLGQVLVRALLAGQYGKVERVTVFSRDEARQHAMRMRLMALGNATDEVIFRDSGSHLEFRIGDVRDPASVRAAIRGHDVVINAAAMKQVPTCEYYPEEAHRTNVTGAVNLFDAVRESSRPPRVVVGVSTDKAVKPVNVMGITKALQERIFIRANLECPDTRFVVVRYGNVLASRGSVLPLFREQLARGDSVTITDRRMTRFLMSLEDAVATIAEAIGQAAPGEITIPRAPAARVVDLATALGGERKVRFRTMGIRPGEKLHEVLVSEEELSRTFSRGDYYVVAPMLPALRRETGEPALRAEYTSARPVIAVERIRALLAHNDLLGTAAGNDTEEILA